MFARLAYQRVSKAARYGLGKPNRKFVGPNAELSCTTNPRSLPNGHYARPLVLATQRPVREVSAPTQCYAESLLRKFTVSVFPMSDGNNENDRVVLIDYVEEPVITNAVSVEL